jgi:hypothetical protein
LKNLFGGDFTAGGPATGYTLLRSDDGLDQLTIFGVSANQWTASNLIFG